MYVIVVNLKIHETNLDEFRAAIEENAEASLAKEPGCHVFDVCWGHEDSSKVLLYEVYDNKEAFDQHLASQHFKSFNETTAQWIAEKSVSAYDRPSK